MPERLNNERGIGARSRRACPLPHDVGGLRKVLREFSSSAGLQASAVVTRSGVPLAWDLPEDTHVDNFGTMSATLIGALEVIYAGLHKPAPERIVVDSGGGVLVARPLTPGAFLVAVAERLTPEIESSMDETAKRARPFLGSED